MNSDPVARRVLAGITYSLHGFTIGLRRPAACTISTRPFLPVTGRNHLQHWQGDAEMNSPETASATEPSLAQDWLHALRYWLRGRRGVAILVLSAVVVGAALNWTWLVAVGIAPLLLTALPCIAMCGLGLCMNRMAGGSCSTSLSASDGARTPTPDTVERLAASEPVEAAPASRTSKAGLVPEDLFSAAKPAPEDPPHVQRERG